MSLTNEGYLIQYKKVVVPGEDKNNLGLNADTWHK
jgi:hypothetical protein